MIDQNAIVCLSNHRGEVAHNDPVIAGSGNQYNSAIHYIDDAVTIHHNGRAYVQVGRHVIVCAPVNWSQSDLILWLDRHYPYDRAHWRPKRAMSPLDIALSRQPCLECDGYDHIYFEAIDESRSQE